VLVRIGENIEALELPINLMGQSSVIYPALLWDSDGATLVDTGIPGQWDAIRRVIENAGVDIESVNRIILTHQDMDHIGGLPDIIRVRGGEIEVLAHEEDRPYIEGDQPLIKMSRERLAQIMESLPELQRHQFERIFSTPPSGRSTAPCTTAKSCGSTGASRLSIHPGIRRDTSVCSSRKQGF